MCALTQAGHHVPLAEELADFYRLHCPGKLANAAAVAAEYAADAGSLKQFLEAKYGVPRAFDTAVVNLSSALLDPLACLYEEDTVVPVPTAPPLDNINRCRVLVRGNRRTGRRLDCPQVVKVVFVVRRWCGSATWRGAGGL